MSWCWAAATVPCLRVKGEYSCGERALMAALEFLIVAGSYHYRNLTFSIVILILYHKIGIHIRAFCQ